VKTNIFWVAPGRNLRSSINEEKGEREGLLKANCGWGRKKIGFTSFAFTAEGGRKRGGVVGDRGWDRNLALLTTSTKKGEAFFLFPEKKERKRTQRIVADSFLRAKRRRTSPYGGGGGVVF